LFLNIDVTCSLRGVGVVLSYFCPDEATPYPIWWRTLGGNTVSLCFHNHGGQSNRAANEQSQAI